MSQTPGRSVSATTPPAGLRIAAIDIGTNSIHLVVARATAAGFEQVDREREVAQTGRGSFSTGRLQPAAMVRSLETLARFVELARRDAVERIHCTATAAVREARNGGAFLRAARARTGIQPRVIPPEEEGRLIYLAVRAAIALDDRPVLILDIGGGSVQLVVGDRERLLRVESVPLGALRLTETMLRDDPPGRDELERLDERVRGQAAGALAAVQALAPARVIGSSGSIHALAEVVHREKTDAPIPQINGHELSLDALASLTARLRKLSLAEREALPGLDAHRAEIILPGAVVLEHVLEALDAPGITLSDYGVREGLVIDDLARHAREIQALAGVEDLRLRSVLQLLEKFLPEERDRTHARHVTRLALALYDGLRPRHRLPDEARALLEYAALLHDVGSAVGNEAHAEHSEYLVRNGNLRGLTAGEVGTIALVARYHGKARPRKSRDPRVAALARDERRTLRWLAAILRIAEGLDRSHYQLVESVRVVLGRRASLVVSARRGARLELWAARQRTDLLERVLGRPVRIRPEAAPGAAAPSRTARGAVIADAGTSAAGARAEAPARS